MMMPPATPSMPPIAGGYAPPQMPAGQMPQMPMQPQMQAPQQDIPPQMRMHLINALENFASR